MRQLIFILTLLLTSIFNCLGQNKTTKEGLKVGIWTEEYDLGYGEFTETGVYKIIPLNTYKTIQSLGDDSFEIKCKASTTILFFSGRHNKSISVKDSIWEIKDSIGKLYSTEMWHQGINIWRKYYDESGSLIEYHYIDLENDTTFNLIYINNRLFKKAFYPPENKNQQTEIFYPNNDLIIPNAELTFKSIFGDTVLNVYQLKLSCKKDLTIQSVRSGSKNIQVVFPFNTFPYELTEKDTAIFNLIFTPTPTTFIENDTITIITSEENVLPYMVFCSLNASHIDYSNVETLTELSLSKTKDQYLIIAPMGTQTDAYITDFLGTKKKYKIYGITKIDLSKLNVGEYQLSIASCNTGGDIKLTITD